MSHTHRKHTHANKRPDCSWMSRRQTQEDEERWFITMEGQRYLNAELSFTPYEDPDTQLGGYDNPHREGS